MFAFSRESRRNNKVVVIKCDQILLTSCKTRVSNNMIPRIGGVQLNPKNKASISFFFIIINVACFGGQTKPLMLGPTCLDGYTSPTSPSTKFFS